MFSFWKKAQPREGIEPQTLRLTTQDTTHELLHFLNKEVTIPVTITSINEFSIIHTWKWLALNPIGRPIWPKFGLGGGDRFIEEFKMGAGAQGTTVIVIKRIWPQEMLGLMYNLANELIIRPAHSVELLIILLLVTLNDYLSKNHIINSFNTAVHIHVHTRIIDKYMQLYSVF